MTQIAWNRLVRNLAPIPHCEGIATGPDGILWAGDEVGRLFRIDPEDGSHEQVADVQGFAVGLCLDRDGFVYVCVYDRGSVVRVDPQTGDTEVYSESVEGGPLAAPNWNLFDAAGTMYVSDSAKQDADYLEVKTGRIVAIPPGGGDARTVPTPPIGYSNGMALDSDGTLFMAETFITPRILAVKDGDVSVYVDLPGTVPDGLAFDVEGALFVSNYQPNSILRIPPGSRDPEVVVDDWTGQRLMTPTNITFCGQDRKTLAIASLCGFSLYTLETPWEGLPLQYPSVPR